MNKRQWLLSALLCLGCDDNGGGGSGGGVSGDKQFEDITVQELRSFCTWVVESEQEAATLQQWCRFEASTEALDEDECQEIYDQCLEEEEPLWESEYQDALDECDGYAESDLPSDCPVPVREVRQCYEDLIASFRSSARNASCEALGESLPDEEPDSCANVDEQCPWLSEEFTARVVSGGEQSPRIVARRMLRRPR